VSIGDSYGIANVNRISQSVYDVTFSSPLQNTHYSVFGSARNVGPCVVYMKNNEPKTVNTFRVNVSDEANEATEVNLTIYGRN
jgi:hypothetical protein